jgi:hypothetical protein
MTAQLDMLMEKLRDVQAEIEAELAKRREELRFHLENRRIVFEKEVLRIHRRVIRPSTRQSVLVFGIEFGVSGFVRLLGYHELPPHLPATLLIGAARFFR